MVYFFCCFYHQPYEPYVLSQYLSLQLLVHQKSFAAKFNQFFLKLHFLFLSKHPPIIRLSRLDLPSRSFVFSRKSSFSWFPDFIDLTLTSAFSIFSHHTLRCFSTNFSSSVSFRSTSPLVLLCLIFWVMGI